MFHAQFAAVERVAHDADGALIHPHLLKRYRTRAPVRENFGGTAEERTTAIAAKG